jgi:hypothetical protein
MALQTKKLIVHRTIKELFFFFILPALFITLPWKKCESMRPIPRRRLGCSATYRSVGAVLSVEHV